VLLEFILTVLTAEIGIDDIEVGDRDMIPLCGEVKRHIDGDIGLSRAVVTA
jgi:hypothetical protein